MNLEHEFLKPQQLMELRQKLHTEIHSIESSLQGSMEAGIDDGNNLADVLDRAVLEEERAQVHARRAKGVKQLSELREALKRLMTDTQDFGYCNSCGDEVQFRRLMIRPTTEKCPHCQRLLELREKQSGRF